MAIPPECDRLGRVFRDAGLLCALILLWFSARPGFAASTPGTALLQPTSVAYDTLGNLYFAESRNHVVRMLDTTGLLTTVAGSTIQGFAGDGASAVAAELDSPRGVALDAANNLYIADTHNNRIRRVDAITHQITTIAGTGSGSFSGDGGPAVAGTLHAPLGLAVDGSNHLYIADSANQRLRMIDLTTGLITTVAGTGQQGFSGDNGPALSATFDSPSGLAADAYGNVFVSDTGNHRIREVSSATRKIVTLAADGTSGLRLLRPEGLSLDAKGGLLISDAATHCVYLFSLASGQLRVVAGQGQQAFAGDQGLATLAMLDSPNGVALGPNGSVVVADTNNGRLRQLSSESGGEITTLAGVGGLLPSALTLLAPPTESYGAATLAGLLESATAGTGSIRLFDVVGGGQQLVGTVPLVGGRATFDLSGLNAGTHQLLAMYSGDSSHAPSQSALMPMVIAPLPVTATVTVPPLVYGQALPVLSGSLFGVLPRDQAAVQASFSLANSTFPLAPGTYALTAGLSGAAAGNYVLARTLSATMTVAQAPVLVTLTHTSSGFLIGVASSTTGQPTGALSLVTAAGGVLASTPVSASGQTVLSDAGLTAGSYAVSAIYSGDANFLSARSPVTDVTIGGASVPPASTDFSIATAGAASQSMRPGGTASFVFAVQAAGQAMSGPILLSVQGAPPNSSATFTPSLVSPGTTTASVTLNVILPRASAMVPASVLSRGGAWAALLPALLLPLAGARRWRSFKAVSLLGLLVMLAGCGDRIVGTTSTGSSSQTYSMVVTGTATKADGTTVQHATTVTLTVP